MKSVVLVARRGTKQIKIKPKILGFAASFPVLLMFVVEIVRIFTTKQKRKNSKANAKNKTKQIARYNKVMKGSKEGNGRV